MTGAAAGESCQAYRRDDGLMKCDRCARAWPVNGARKECGAVTFKWMRYVVEVEAQHIEASQAALITVGVAKLPDVQQIEKALVLRAVVRLIDRVTSDETIMHALQARRARE